jgi:hypothetical protein
MHPDITQPAGLLYNPKILKFKLAQLGILHVTTTPAILAVKGGIIGRGNGKKIFPECSEYTLL